MSTVLVALFNDYETAKHVRQMLIHDGFPTDRVDLTASHELGRARLQPADSPRGKCIQYFRSVLPREDEQGHAEMLAQRIDEGAACVTVLPRGAIETEGATQILRQAHPTHILGHDLTVHGWERAASRHKAAWAQYVWIESSPSDTHCIYCRLFPERAVSMPPAQSEPQAEAAMSLEAEMFLSGSEVRDIGVRRVRPLQALEWLSKGWDDLRSTRSASLVHGALIVLLGGVLLILGDTHPYFLVAAVSGYLLIGPIMTTGACELSRRRAAGEPLGFDESLHSVTRNAKALIQFGAVLTALTFVWFVASEVMLRSVLHGAEWSAGQALWSGFTAMAGRSQTIAYIASGAVLAALVFTTSVVTVPLIIDRRASALEAMWVSIKATFCNLPAMLVWSALIVVLAAFGFLTMLIGMVFIAPLLGHATWHAYRSLVE
jgi:uncharacterized membrane protein